MPSIPGDVVQILQAIDDDILPPNEDGTPNAANVLLHVTHIGCGALPLPAYAGTFGAALVPRPSGKIFVRVFDAPSITQATHYGDSQLFTVNGNNVFLAQVEFTNEEFAEDSDGDGITDPWESHLGSDPDNEDSDGDGMSDGAEYRAGTGLGDPQSNLGLITVREVAPGLWTVGWQSVPGRAYRVDYTSDKLTAQRTYSEVSPVVIATGATSQVQATVPVQDEKGHFRVRLVE